MKYRRISNKKFLYITYGILAILLVVLFVILFSWYNKSMAGFEPGVETYQFVNAVRLDYSKDAAFYDGEDQLLVEENGDKRNIANAPLLYSGSTKMTIMKNMLFIDTEKNAPAKRVVRFTSITPAGSTSTLDYQDTSAITFGGFLYDGDNTYIFLNDTTITYGEEKIELPAMSYIDTGTSGVITYYDSEKKEAYEFNSVGANLEATSDSYHLNLTLDSMYKGDSEYLLITSVDTVEDLEME